MMHIVKPNGFYLKTKSIPKMGSKTLNKSSALNLGLINDKYRGDKFLLSPLTCVVD